MYSVQYNIYDTYENVLDFCFPGSQGGRDEYFYSIKVYFIGAGAEICKPDYHQILQIHRSFLRTLTNKQTSFSPPPFNASSNPFFPLPKKNRVFPFLF